MTTNVLKFSANGYARMAWWLSIPSARAACEQRRYCIQMAMSRDQISFSSITCQGIILTILYVGRFGISFQKYVIPVYITSKTGGF